MELNSFVFRDFVRGTQRLLWGNEGVRSRLMAAAAAAAPSSGPGGREGERRREEETASRLVTIQITRTFYATAGSAVAGGLSPLSLSSAHLRSRLRHGCFMHGGGGGSGVARPGAI